MFFLYNIYRTYTDENKIMAKETIMVAVRLDPKEHEQVIKLTKQEDLTISQIIRRALRDYVKKMLIVDKEE